VLAAIIEERHEEEILEVHDCPDEPVFSAEKGTDSSAPMPQNSTAPQGAAAHENYGTCAQTMGPGIFYQNVYPTEKGAVSLAPQQYCNPAPQPVRATRFFPLSNTLVFGNGGEYGNHGQTMEPDMYHDTHRNSFFGSGHTMGAAMGPVRVNQGFGIPPPSGQDYDPDRASVYSQVYPPSAPTSNVYHTNVSSY
jgi:hypothetical protein